MKINHKVPVAILSASVIAIFGIKAEEGYRAKPYHDIGKVATVGHGSTVYEDGSKVKITDPPVSRERADKMLRAHVNKDEAKMKAMLPGVELSQGEYDVYIDFFYNFGAQKFYMSSMRRELLKGNHVAACRALLRYRFAAGRDCSRPSNWGPRGCKGVWTRTEKRYNNCMAAQ